MRDPVTRALWLLRKKCFQIRPNEDGELVADVDQKVPVCSDCADSLGADNPKLPKYALSSDLWLGRLPPALQDWSEGAWMLLALARPFIH